MSTILLYISSFFLVFWGIAHLFPTRNVIREFGEISADNKRILAMEWINEGATLVFLGSLILTITLVDPAHSISRLVFICVFGFLNVLSTISLFTGFRVNFPAYKICPVIFTGSSILILLGGII
jgi:hypothetical protein